MATKHALVQIVDVDLIRMLIRLKLLRNFSKHASINLQGTQETLLMRHRNWVSASLTVFCEFVVILFVGLRRLRFIVAGFLLEFLFISLPLVSFGSSSSRRHRCLWHVEASFELFRPFSLVIIDRRLHLGSQAVFFLVFFLTLKVLIFLFSGTLLHFEIFQKNN